MEARENEISNDIRQVRSQSGSLRNVEAVKKDYLDRLQCGKAEISLAKVASSMKDGLNDTISGASDKELFLVLGPSGTGKSVSITHQVGYHKGLRLKRVDYGKVGLDHGAGLSLIYPEQTQLDQEIDDWKNKHEIGHILVAPTFQEDNPWKLWLIIDEKKNCTSRDLTREEVEHLYLGEVNDRSVQEYNLDRVFHYIIEKKIFTSHTLRFSKYLNENYPGFKESLNSQTTFVRTYEDQWGNSVSDCAGFGDTRVKKLISGVPLSEQEGTPEEAIMTTMSMTLAIQKAKAIKGIILVITPSMLEQRGAALFNYLSDLVHCIPKLQSSKQLRKLEKSIVVMVTHIPTESGQDNLLSKRHISQFEGQVGRYYGDFKKQIGSQEKEFEKIDGSGLQHWAANKINSASNFITKKVVGEDINEFKRKLLNQALLSQDTGTMLMLEIINKKIKSKEIVYYNPTDSGESVAMLGDRLKALNDSVPKNLFEFAGANKIHEAFERAIVLTATHAVELVNKRDVQLLESISILEAEIQEQNKLLASVKKNISLLEGSILQGGIDNQKREELISILQTEITTMKKLIENKTKRKTDVLQNEFDVLEKRVKKLYEEGEIEVHSDWEEVHYDNRNERHLLQHFKTNSAHTFDIKFPHPYEAILIQCGGYGPHDSREQDDDFLSFLTDGTYKTIQGKKQSENHYIASYECSNWYFHHQPITLRALIKKKHHPATQNEIQVIEEEMKIKTKEIVDLEREINYLNTNIETKRISISKLQDSKPNIGELQLRLNDAGIEQKNVQDKINSCNAEIQILKEQRTAVQQEIDKNYPTFATIKEIASIVHFDEAKVNKFVNQFNILKKITGTKTQNSPLSSNFGSGIFSPATRRKSPDLDASVIFELEEIVSANDITVIKTKYPEVISKLQDINKEIDRLNNDLDTLRRKMRSLVEIKNKMEGCLGTEAETEVENKFRTMAS